MTLEDAQRGEEGWGRYKPRPHMTELESLLILNGVDGVLSLNRGKIVGALEISEIKTLSPSRMDHLPLLMTSLRACRSSGYLATGLQKFQA